MGKRSLVDPAVKKRKRTGEGFGTKREMREEVVMEDLWGEGTPTPARPGNKEHGASKRYRIDEMSKALKVVNLPGQAQSYNPPQKEHLNAIGKAVDKLKRTEQLKKRIADSMKINPKVKKGCVGDDLTETAWEEVIQGEPAEETKLKGRKTRTQRNKARRLAVALELKKRRKQRSKVVADADKIDDIIKEIEDGRAASAKRQAVKKENRLGRLMNPRIGRRRFKEPAMDLQTTSDVRSSLREQGGVCSSMRDPLKLRFESFQSRNIIPATAPLVSRRPKRPAKYFVITEREG